MNFIFKSKKFRRLIYASFSGLIFLFLFFIININVVQAADFKVNVGSTEWKINDTGIYKNSTKIYCSNIQTGTVPNIDGFLVKNSSDTKLFLITENNIYATARDPFGSLTYPGGISDSFILKKANDDILLYVDGSGLYYKDGLCSNDNYTCVEPTDPSNRDCDQREDDYCDNGCNLDEYATWSNSMGCDFSSGVCSGCCKAELSSSGYWSSCHWEGGGTGTSFRENTVIDLQDGSKKITDIQAGDIVKSYDEINKEIVFTRVLSVRNRVSDSYYLLNFKIEVTGNHEFYVNGEWVSAKDLKLGDKLFDGEKNIILWSSIKIDKPVIVYNFDTEAPYDNYFAEGVLVHNDEDGACEPPNSNYSNCQNYSVLYEGVTCDKDDYGTPNQETCCEYGGVYDTCEGNPTDSCSDYNNSQSQCAGHGCVWEINPNHPCGNGNIDAGEDCDGSFLNGQSCESQGFWGGDLSCNPVTCQFDTSECHVTEPPHCQGEYFACEDVNIWEQNGLYYDDFDLYPVTCYDNNLVGGYYTGLDGCGCNWKWACLDGGCPSQFGCQGGGFIGWVDDPDDCTGGCGGGCHNYPADAPVCVCEGSHLEASNFETEAECILNGYTWVE